MPPVDADPDGDRPLTRVFVSPKLAEARRVEALLIGKGVEYVVEPEPLGRTLLGSPRYWAAFYVDPGQAHYCVALLVEAGLGAGVVLEDARE